MNRMINEKEMLIYAIALRYWELRGVAHIGDSDLLDKIYRHIRPQDRAVVDIHSSSDNIKNLHAYLGTLIHMKQALPYSIAKQTLRLSIKDDEELYNTAIECIDEKRDETETSRLCQSYHYYIRQWFDKQDYVEKIKKLVSSKIYGNEEFDILEFSRSVIETSQPYAIAKGVTSGDFVANTMVVDGFMTGDGNSLEEAIVKTQESVNPESILKTGYAGLNEALGPQQGFFRGDTIVLGALQHNYKSGMVNDLLLDIMRCNKPYYFTTAKKAAIVKISLENQTSDDVMRLYQRIVADTRHTLVDLNDVLNSDPKQIAGIIGEYCEETGFHLIHVRINPSNYGYMDILDYLQNIIDNGFEVHMLFIDYLITLSMKGIMKKGDGTEYQDLYRYVRNFCTERMITFLTPHQLSTEATYLNRDEIGAEFVNQVAGNSYYAKCKQIDREVDVEIIQHLVKKKNVDGSTKTYLTMRVGKNRRVHNVPEEKKSFAMEFSELGLIRDVKGITEEMERKPRFIKISSLRKMGAASSEEDTW